MIDGYTQAGASANTLAVGTDASLLVVLDGTNAGSATNGLTINGGNVTIRGLVINNFSRAGINIEGGDGNRIVGNYVGTNAAGTAAAPNGANGGWDGVVIGTDTTSSYNVIGGPAPADRNVISGNHGGGVWMVSSNGGNTIQGNYIGTNAAGTLGIGNQQHGVKLVGAGDRVIGNVISANAHSSSYYGLLLSGSASGSMIQGNLIGLNATGTSTLGNGNAGIYLDGAQGITIGGTTAAARNVVSGNAGAGIQITGSSATGTLIQGNYIGTDATGTIALGNAWDGIVISGGAKTNAIGGTDPGQANIISGNNNDGIWITGTNTSGNRVQGNWIGLNAVGGALGNSFHGIALENGASSNLIGGTTAGAGNRIAYNAYSGIMIPSATASGNALLGNELFANTDLGIDLGSNGVTANGAGNLQNFPMLTAAKTDGTFIKIAGALNSVANTSFRIEFFSNPVADSSGHGEGQTYLGFEIVTTDASGNAIINTTLTASVSVGASLSATATNNTTNDTSEFALNIVVGALVANTAPTTTGLSNSTVNEDAGFSYIDLTARFADAEDASTALVYTIVGNTNPTLFDAASINASGVLTLDYATNLNGSSTITIRATDTGGLWVESTFTATVNAVNDPPVRTAGTVDNLTVLEDSGFTSLGLGSVTYGPGGGADESGQTLSYAVTVIPGSIGNVYLADGTTLVTTGSYNLAQIQGMQFKTTADESGVTGFEYKVTDSSGTANGGFEDISQFILITVTAVNDAATLTAAALDPTFTEAPGLGTQAPAVSVFGGAAVSTIESGQTIAGLNFTVSGLIDGVHEVVVVDGRTITLGANSSGFTVANGLAYNATISGNTATIVLSGGTLSTAATQTLVNGITYQNTNTDNPTAGDRVVTLTQLKDNGGTANGGADTTILSIVSTVTVTAVNDPPVNTLYGEGSVSPEDTTVQLLNSVVIADVDGGAGSYTVTLSVNAAAGTLSAVSGAGVTVSGTGTTTLVFTGTLSSINSYFAASATAPLFTPVADYNGLVSVTLVTNDNGNAGSGGALSDSDTANGTISAVADIADDSVVTNEDTPVTFSPLSNDTFENAGRVITQINGTTISTGGSVAVTGGTVTLNAGGTLTFAPTANYNGTPTFTYTVASGGTTETATVSVTVTAVNDAPVLDNSGNMTLTPITEDATNGPGQTVASIVLSAGGDRIADVDTGAVEGIAITGATVGNSFWQYSTNGGTSWSSLGAVSNSSALLLRDTDLVRFIGNGSNATTASLTFRAWDRTAGTVGAKVTTASNGGTTAFSSATEVATIDVTAVNDAPNITDGGTYTFTGTNEDTPSPSQLVHNIT